MMGPLRSPRVALALLLGFLLAPATRGEEPAPKGVAADAKALAAFENDVRPLLVARCIKCHGASKQESNLRLDARDAMMQGGDSGPAIVPGKPDESLLVKAVRHEGEVQMPPGPKLKEGQIATLSRWIADGAAWPEEAKGGAVRRGAITAEDRSFWSFRPPAPAPAPTVLDRDWVRSPIDLRILKTLESKKLQPAKPADKRTLIRRATFDLTGLPPKVEEVDRFLADSSPDAFAKVVDRLLASPAYGERWGRYWLDVVRYADTAGETADYPVREAVRYRDYVIDAFNRDLPYDQFVREQVAGDVLAEENPDGDFARKVSATGFIAVSRRFGFDSENYHHLTIQDSIDTLGQTFLGLTLGCARCHDHKFDPVSTRDYYALYGIFESTRYPFPGSEQKPGVRTMAPLEPRAEAQARFLEYRRELARVETELSAFKVAPSKTTIRPLTDLDGDFELQAQSAGGSTGVPVPPWSFEGRPEAVPDAQSPFTNLTGRVGTIGIRLPSPAPENRLWQQLWPQWRVEGSKRVHMNIDMRYHEGKPGGGVYRLSLGHGLGRAPAVEIDLGGGSLIVRDGTSRVPIRALKPGVWLNLQLTLDLERRTYSGTMGTPGDLTSFADKAFAPEWDGTVDCFLVAGQGGAADAGPALDVDNVAVDASSLPSVESPSKEAPETAPKTDFAAIEAEIRTRGDEDGGLEFQNRDGAPVLPWDFVGTVRASAEAQSPYRNLFDAGKLGARFANDAANNGLGVTVHPTRNLARQERLYFNADFRNADKAAAGSGTYRFYLGHGPGVSAAVELFANDGKFFVRNGGSIEEVRPLEFGTWYNVQLVLDLKSRTYSGTIGTPGDLRSFSGKAFHPTWDGTIDYFFVDGYGHIGGVKPSHDLDNVGVRDEPIPSPSTASTPNPVASSPRAGTGELSKTPLSELVKQRAEVGTARARLERRRAELLEQGPFAAAAYGVSEGTPHDARIQKRGEPTKPGDLVPRRFLEVLGGDSVPEISEGSGRLQLAQWLTRPENPLTARVMVNRLWKDHFGNGLVATENDFGKRGRPATHPGLLDELALRFIQSGWSIKAMHRLIMLSSTYQLSSTADPLGDDIDPGVELLWRFPRRRLDAESLRDSLLMLGGNLDRSRGGAHPFPPVGTAFSQHGPFGATYEHNQRTVYLMSQRIKRHPFLALFDGPDPNASTAKRSTTTVPTQALFFMNDPFVHEQSVGFARRLLDGGATDDERLRLAYRMALAREPGAEELASGLAFLVRYRRALESTEPSAEARAIGGWSAFARTVFASNEFLYLD